LEEYAIEDKVSVKQKSDLVFENVVGQDSLNRFDPPKRSKNMRRKERKPNRRQNDA
jgi:hypothetical protein